MSCRFFSHIYVEEDSVSRNMCDLGSKKYRTWLKNSYCILCLCSNGMIFLNIYSQEIKRNEKLICNRAPPSSAEYTAGVPHTAVIHLRNIKQTSSSAYLVNCPSPHTYVLKDSILPTCPIPMTCTEFLGTSALVGPILNSNNLAEDFNSDDFV